MDHRFHDLIEQRRRRFHREFHPDVSHAGRTNVAACLVMPLLNPCPAHAGNRSVRRQHPLFTGTSASAKGAACNPAKALADATPELGLGPQREQKQPGSHHRDEADQLDDTARLDPGP